MVTTDVFVFRNAFFMFYLNVVCFPHLCLIYDFCVFFVYLFTTFLIPIFFSLFAGFRERFFSQEYRFSFVFMIKCMRVGMRCLEEEEGGVKCYKRLLEVRSWGKGCEGRLFLAGVLILSFL